MWDITVEYNLVQLLVECSLNWNLIREVVATRYRVPILWPPSRGFISGLYCNYVYWYPCTKHYSSTQVPCTITKEGSPSWPGSSSVYIPPFVQKNVFWNIYLRCFLRHLLFHVTCIILSELLLTINKVCFVFLSHLSFKGIVSRDFGGLQMILMNRTWVPDVPLEVYSFLNFRFHIVI